MTTSASKSLRFRDLFPGQRFEFDHTGLPLGSGIATGPWIKLSPRRYRLAGTLGPDHRIGTVAATVEVRP